MMKDKKNKQNLFKWEFHIQVTTLSGYCVDNTIIKEVSAEEYRLLEEGRNRHLELKYNAELVDVYEETWWDAYEQEEMRCEKCEEYLEVEDFWYECIVEITY